MSVASAENPFPGLRPFEFDDRAFFFGRDQQVQELFRQLVANRFVAVVGASGSGKSSLVKAGLCGRVADIEAAGAGVRWHVISLRPLGRPLHQLASALVDARQAGAGGQQSREQPGRNDTSMAVSRAVARLSRSSEDFTGLLDELKLREGDHLVVIVDQFEELFRYPHMDEDVDFDERAFFVKHLLSAARAPDRNYHVLITMRSEFIGECTSFQGLAEAINDSQFLTPRLTRAQRREAILGPIELAQGEIAPELLQRLLNDVGHEPDQLPVMQHALMRSWQVAQPGRRLEMRHYESVGCMAAAISNHADAVLGRLQPAEQRIAEQLFKALTDVDRDGRVIRRPLRVGQLIDVVGGKPAQVMGVIEAFRATDCAFLVPSGDAPIDNESVIDITHEALIRKWGRLNTWVQEEANNGRIYARLRDVADQFRRNPKALLGPYEAQDRKGWWDEASPTAAWAKRYSGGKDDVTVTDVQHLISASIAEGRREHRRRMGLLGAIALIAVVAAAVSGYFWFEANKATQLAVAAEKKAVDERDLANKAASEADRARLATQEANKHLIAETTRADQALRDVYRSRATQATRIVDEGDAVTGALLALELLPDETSPSDRVQHRPYSVEARAALEHALGEIREQSILHGHDGNVLSTAFSPDGQFILTASSDGTARLWNAGSGEQVRVFAGHHAPVESAVFSPAGERQTVLTASDDGTARLWDTETGAEIATFKHDGKVYTARFSADGKRIVTASADNTARIWDVPSGVQRPSGMSIPPSVPAAPIGSKNAGIVLESGGELKKFDGEGRETYSAAFSPDGRLVVTTSDDGKARIWNVSTGNIVLTLEADGDSVYDAEFSPPDGEWIVTAGPNNTARIWDAKTGESLLTLSGHEGGLLHAQYSPDGSKVVTVSNDMTARVWDAEDGSELQSFKVNGESVSSAAFTPDGLRIVTGHSDGTARIWAVGANSIAPERLDVQGDYVTHVEASSDGLFLVTTSMDQNVRIWDAKTLELKEILDHDASSAVFSSDGKRVLTASEDGNVRIWDLATGAPRTFRIVEEGAVTSAVFDPTETHFLTTAEEAAATLWDIETGKAVRRFPFDSLPSFAIFSPDGKQVLTVAGNVGQLRDAESGEIAQTYDHEEAITYAAFSSTGDRLVTASQDGTAKVWETASGRPLSVVGDHVWTIFSAVFSHDDSQILTASEDSTARIWDAQTGGLIRVLSGHADYVRHATFAPDGRALTASDDGTVRIWPLFGSPQGAVDFAQETLPRCLTSKQQRDFNLPLDPPPFCRPDKWPSTSPLYHLSEGKALLAAGNDEKARGLFAVALTQDSSLSGGVADAYVERGRQRLSSGKDGLAAADFAEAIKRNPGGEPEYKAAFAQAYLDRAIRHIENDENAKAESDFAAAVRRNPDGRTDYAQALARAMVERSATALEMEDDEAAQASLAAAIKLDLDHAKDHKASFADALVKRAQTRISDGSDEAAKADFAAAIVANPDREPAYLGLIAEAYIARAEDDIKSGKDDDAHRDAREAVSRNPNGKPDYDKRFAEALIARGSERLSDNDIAAAVSDFISALATDPQTESSVSAAYGARGWDLQNQNKYSDALSSFKLALVYDPSNADAYIGIASVLNYTNHKVLALEEVSNALRIDPTNRLGYTWRGWISRSLGDYEQSVTDYSKAIQLSDSDTLNYTGRAVAFFSLLKFDDGRKDIEQAMNNGNDTALADVIGDTVVWHPITDGLAASDLLIGISLYAELSADEIKTVGIEFLKNSLGNVSYNIGALYLVSQTKVSDTPFPRKCDELAAAPSDPFRVVPHGVPFEEIRAQEAIAACDDAIRVSEEPRFYFQRSRAHGSSAEAAKEVGDDELMSDEYAKERSDLLHLSTVLYDGILGYPASFNNLGYNYHFGVGVDKDLAKAGEYYLATFNRIVDCCATGAVETLLAAETGYDRPIVLRTASTLLDWGADLGSPGAHEKLAELAADGTLDTFGEAPTPRAYVLRHLLIAERLYRERAAMPTLRSPGQSAESDLKQAEILSARAKELGAELTSEEMSEIEAEAAAFVPKPLDASPPWLATTSN